MRRAETVLAVIRERGKRGLPLQDVYPLLFNPELFLRAYGRLYRNDGAMTPGATPETADGMGLEKIESIIEALRFERYRWTPARRTYIRKKNGKMRPLGMPTWSDKLVQEVIRLILEAYYEPQFSDSSHGFRPERGCHTALKSVAQTWTGTKWFIEGDIKGFFDNIDHQVLLSVLREKIHDNRFIRLIENLLKAGYLEDWIYHPTLSGAPQGGVLSPLLSNIYLDRLDQFVEMILLPRYNRGEARRRDADYARLSVRRRNCLKTGRFAEAKAAHKQLKTMSSVDTQDPDYRRLRYVRYADDFLLGFVGPKAEAEEIKELLKAFLRDTLKLELSPEKTLLTHATTGAARFLGHDISCYAPGDKTDHLGRRITGGISLRIPAEVIEGRCATYMKAGQPMHRAKLASESVYAIIQKFQAEYRGFVQYYVHAQNLAWLQRLHWVMKIALLRTLALKFRSSVASMFRMYRSTAATTRGPRCCLRATLEREGKVPLVATFGGIPLVRRKTFTVMVDHPLHLAPRFSRELLLRLKRAICELCGVPGPVQMHQVRKLADLKVCRPESKPPWIQAMLELRRKTLAVCPTCHVTIHSAKSSRMVVT